ncbi:dnaJ homolog subfamily C member 12-like [Dreissena polymorpha]|uniref:J domain-containing protein n=1 Tax=Dreissena polymorpha TaxID=45954 RepID=A0A9D4RCF3_DREPO|nr:dnaJ homolog subfamily C member 12-like [Dreissena polymorpha]KAH3861632.1 hypothetical protein DPMN_024566 [Dreissena polymorpha]
MSELLIDVFEDNDEDFYAILGCDELSSKEQIIAEYRARVLHCHPDKHPGEVDKAAEFERIQTAKDVLTDDEKRQNYDKWRHSGISIPFSKWCNMRGAVHTSMHWATPKKETMLEGSCHLAEMEQTHSHVIDSKCEDLNDVFTATDRYSMKTVPSTPWQREPASEMLRKFRNYEI